MRIMFDSIVLLNVLCDNNPKYKQFLEMILLDHSLLLPLCVVNEIKCSIKSCCPDKLNDIDTFLRSADYELIYSSESSVCDSGAAHVHNELLLQSALDSNADFLITDNMEEKTTHGGLKIMTLDSFIDKYM